MGNEKASERGLYTFTVNSKKSIECPLRLIWKTHVFKITCRLRFYDLIIGSFLPHAEYDELEMAPGWMVDQCDVGLKPLKHLTLR